MTSILKATAILGSGSAVTLLMGILSNKVYAVLLGPSGIGFLGLLQSFLGITSLVAGMGLASGLVRLGSPLVATEEMVKLSALRLAAWQIYFYSSAILTAVLLVLAKPLSRLFLADSPVWIIFFIMVAMWLGLAAGVQIGLLNVYHRVSALAHVTALSSLIGTLVGVGAVWLWGNLALPVVLLGTPLAQWIVSRFFWLKQDLARPPINVGLVRQARLELLRFGFPFMASQVVGMGVQFSLPFLVLKELGQTEVGYYKAAIMISGIYVGTITSALIQDYYPRVSAELDWNRLQQSINQQLRLLLILATPIVVLLLGLRDEVMRLAFSVEFLSATQILAWTLPADLLRLASWTLAVVLMAKIPVRSFFMLEGISGLSLLGFVWLGISRMGLEGAGLGIFLSATFYLCLVWWTLKQMGPSLNLSNVQLLIGAVFIALCANVTPPGLTLLVGCLLAIAASKWVLDKWKTNQ